MSILSKLLTLLSQDRRRVERKRTGSYRISLNNRLTTWVFQNFFFLPFKNKSFNLYVWPFCWKATVLLVVCADKSIFVNVSVYVSWWQRQSTTPDKCTSCGFALLEHINTHITLTRLSSLKRRFIINICVVQSFRIRLNEPIKNSSPPYGHDQQRTTGIEHFCFGNNLKKSNVKT